MTLSTPITRTASRIRRVHDELTHVNRRMFELTVALPEDMPTQLTRPARPSRDQLPLSGQHITL